MPKRLTLTVSKTDAAKSQIETAIRLWLSSGDPVSIHTLAAAALQILHDLGKKQGMPAILRGLPGIRAEHKKELGELVTRYENFFKHADRDPAALLNFNPQATELYLLDAVFTYENLTQDVAPLLSTFKAWMIIQNPYYVGKGDREQLIHRLDACSTDFVKMPKVEFFAQYQSLLMTLGVD